MQKFAAFAYRRVMKRSFIPLVNSLIFQSDWFDFNKISKDSINHSWECCSIIGRRSENTVTYFFNTSSGIRRYHSYACNCGCPDSKWPSNNLYGFGISGNGAIFNGLFCYTSSRANIFWSSKIHYHFNANKNTQYTATCPHDKYLVFIYICWKYSTFLSQKFNKTCTQNDQNLQTSWAFDRLFTSCIPVA